MFGMLALGGMIMAAFVVLAVFGLALFLVKGLLFLVLLPFRLLFGLLMFPLRVAGGVIGLLLLPLFGVLALLVAVAVFLGGLLTLALPLLPLAALVLLVWFLSRPSRRRAAV